MFQDDGEDDEVEVKKSRERLVKKTPPRKKAPAPPKKANIPPPVVKRSDGLYDSQVRK